MSNIVQVNPIESALISGDLSKLSADQRLSYYKNVCESLGLNQLTQPFSYITLNGKLTLYAKRDATDQLRKVHGVSITISAREKIDDLYVVTARARDKNGREDESTGAVNISGLKGDALANAFLKSETKAKRRVTLSICGLGLLDESEIETIPNINKETVSINSNSEIDRTLPKGILFEKAPEIDPAEYVPSFGKYKGIKLMDIDMFHLANYVEYIESESKKNGKEIKNGVLEFMNHATKYLNSLDSSMMG